MSQSWSRVFLVGAFLLLGGLGASQPGAAQEAGALRTSPAPGAVQRAAPEALTIDWARFDRLVEVARNIPMPERLPDAARALQQAVPAEAGRLQPLDWYCLGNAWWALHYPGHKGKPLYRDASGMEGEELYRLLRQGYRLDDEQWGRILVRLLSLLGVPSEVVTGLVRQKTLDRGVWVVSQVGDTWLRTDLAHCLPASGDWRPDAAFFQASAGLDGVLAFLKTHLPDGESTARLQGLAQPFTLSQWEAWSKAEASLREKAQQGAGNLLYVSRIALLTPQPVGENRPDAGNAPPSAEALSALEKLRRKPFKPTRGQHLVDTALKFVGLPYTWGGETPSSGFDCSGLVRYVCRQWGIALPRTAAEQYHMGRSVGFYDLEPGDLVFLADTYKPGVSHVGIYIGDGRWVQAAGTGIGVIVGDVPYFDAGNGPGARRLNFSRLPRVAGEPIPERVVARASRHLASRRGGSRSAGTGGIVTIKVCGDSGDLAHSGCDTYKVLRVPAAQAKRMHFCRRHRPVPGERS